MQRGFARPRLRRAKGVCATYLASCKGCLRDVSCVAQIFFFFFFFFFAKDFFYLIFNKHCNYYYFFFFAKDFFYLIFNKHCN